MESDGPWRGAPPPRARRVRVGRVALDAVDAAGALDAIAALVACGRGGSVFTANVDHVVRAERDDGFRALYAAADLALADGMAVVWASRLAGDRLPERVAGSDLVVPLARLSARRGWRLYLLGGAPGDAERAATVLSRETGVTIAGVDAPRVSADAADPESARAAERVRAAAPELVYVALGSPKQERWIARHLATIRPAVALGIGASLAFVAGTERRAPRWMGRLGLEWLHRLSRDPRRMWRRYLVDDVAFLPILLRDLRRRGRGADP